LHRANYSCKKFSFTTYRLVTIHLLLTDGQTTDDNRAKDGCSIAVLRQKC